MIEFWFRSEVGNSVGQIQAAGAGLNIQAASVVILCEPQIKPSPELQAIARAHRMGQVRKVQVHRLILPESVDEQMLTMLGRKQSEIDAYAKESDLANSAIGAQEISEESIVKVIVMDERRRLPLRLCEPFISSNPIYNVLVKSLKYVLTLLCPRPGKG